MSVAPRIVMAMATRNMARRLQDLIEQASSFEALASTAQGDDEVVGLAAAKTLTTAYRGWFTSSMGLLPEDLRDRFRNEYEKGFPDYKIKYFMENPRKKNPIYRDDLPDASKEIWSYWQFPFKEKFVAPLNQQLSYLDEALARCRVDSGTAEALELLEKIARRLPIAFSILGRGDTKNARITIPKLSIVNEYDVQHILHSIAVLYFDEVEPEESTPKMAGSYSKLDFLLKGERVAVEVKMMRDSLTLKKLRAELAEDIIYYRAHPNVTSLFALVYDPERTITNAVGFENDLRSDSDDFVVRVVIVS